MNYSPQIQSWIKEHGANHRGKVVALKNGELIAVGITHADASVQARAKGIYDAVIVRVPEESPGFAPASQQS